MPHFRLHRLRILIFFGVVVFLGALFIYLWNLDAPVPTAAEKKDILVAAFEESGAAFQELTAQSWGKVGTGRENLPELEALYEKVVASLGEGAKVTIEEATEENYVGLSATGKTPQGYDINITLQSIKDNYEEDETYLIIDLHENLDSKEAAGIRQTAENCFAAVNAKGETSVLISGYFEHILNGEAKKALTTAVFASVGGESVETVDSGTYISDSGYCPGLPRSITANGQEINLQIALFDNEVQNQTGIFIGTPLIFSEY
ncbi:MAG: YwmB family TATA-box binding protein [Bacillota bacterium]|nr:YwmB family TATA-box binding protein [Bacillota bacterium]